MLRSRRFLIASALARLIRKEQGVEARVVEGHFPGQFGRTHFVSFEPGHAYLVLTDPDAHGGTAEERAEVPGRHAEALLDVCQGRIGYERTRLALEAGYEIVLTRFVEPAGLDVLTVVFEDGHDVEAFAAPAWFGPEVTGDPAWQRHSLALNGPPPVEELPVSNAALDALLESLEAPGRAAALIDDWTLRSGVAR